MERGHDSREGDAARALYIVVEASNFGRVLVEYSPCIVQAKVLEMKVRTWVSFPTCSDELVDELVVLFTAYALFPQAEIEVVFE
jgi:hypothetical protein